MRWPVGIQPVRPVPVLRRGHGAEYPAASPNVIAVGGTTLNGCNGTSCAGFTSETTWSFMDAAIRRGRSERRDGCEMIVYNE